MVKNASPRPGDVYLKFNGRDAYVEIPGIAGYSVSTTGELTISAWLRPDTLNFPSVERNAVPRAREPRGGKRHRDAAGDPHREISIHHDYSIARLSVTASRGA